LKPGACEVPRSRSCGCADRRVVAWRGTQVVREEPQRSYAPVRVRPAPSNLAFNYGYYARPLEIPYYSESGRALSHTTKDLKQQLARIRRIRGQVEAIERALRGDRDSEQILQLVASCRGALNGLMAVLIEGHLRFHVLPPSGRADSGQLEAAEELVAVVKRYFQ